MNLSRTFVSIILLLFCSCKDHSNSDFWKEAPLDKKKIYLAYRGTRSKEGFFAKEFNIKDSLSSHVGLLLNDKYNWHVYQVLDFEDEDSDLRSQEASLFFNPIKEGISYASIWVISSFDSIKINSLRDRIKYFESKFIEFDRAFSLNDSTNLYCSEFIYRILNYSEPLGFGLKPRKIKLTGIYASYFKKDSLEYIPVDAFQFNKNVQLIKEWFFE